MACQKVCKQDSKSTWWHHFLLQREEEEHVMVQNLKILAPHVLKIEHTFTQACSSTVYASQCTVTLVINKMWVLQAYLASSTWLLALPDVRNPSLTWWRGPRSFSVKLMSYSLAWLMHSPYPTDKPLTRLFGSYFHSLFTLMRFWRQGWYTAECEKMQG